MPPSDFVRRISSSFSSLGPIKYKLALSLLAVLFGGFCCLAQEQSPAPPVSTPDLQAIESNNLLLPAGTRIALVLTHPIQSRHVHRGDDIYAQITSPVTSGSQVAIPPGTFIQGKVDKLGRRGGRGELHLQSASLTFPNGYVAPIAGPMTLESDEGYAIKDPGKGRMVSAFVLPAAGAGLGALVGHAAGGSGTDINGMNFNPDGLKSTAIGSMVGLAVGGVASLVMLTSSPNFYLDVGSPVEMVLQQPLTLDREQVAEAITHASPAVQAIAQRPQPPPPDNNSTSPFDCPAGEEYCHGSCVSTASFISDSNNCGRCGNHCSFSESCTGGSCSCGPGYSSCMGSCVSQASFMSDSSNCGRCGNSCSIGESCTGGTCMRTTPCVPGEINCH
jgi:hypothetical protein